MEVKVIRWTEEGVPDISGTPFVIDGNDWHDGQGMSPMYACESLEDWGKFKVQNLDGVEDMSFQLREVATGHIYDAWHSREENYEVL